MALHETKVHHDASAYPGPKQPGNDIDVYLRPLVEELLLLWGDEGARMWDEYKLENFNLRAMLFVTINDWPALSNLSVVRKKDNHFIGQADHRTKPMQRSGKDVFNMVKNVEVIKYIFNSINIYSI